MPTRLIAILSHGQLQLVETNGGTQRYTALSYKWGKSQLFQAKVDSMPLLTSGFHMDKLPDTLKDAVIVTQKLGLSHLWVDAVCIIQDSEVDKSTEMARMAAVYENAAVTIASSRTDGARESFLKERTKFKELFNHASEPELFAFHYRCQDEQPGSIVLMHKYVPKLGEPLDGRGWAFQERLLSPRMIDYRSEQTKWMCRASEGQPSFTDGWMDNTAGYEDQGFLVQSRETIHRSPHELTSRNVRDARYQWYQVLALYTSRALGTKTDRLPAISAVAQRYSEILNSKYLAGLWESWLGEELLWKQGRNIPFSVRPETYQGPSWSWAGISWNTDGTAPIEIKMLSHSERWATITSPDPFIRKYSKVAAQDAFTTGGDAFQVVSFDVQPFSPNAIFGEVKQGACLTLRGHLRPARLSTSFSAATQFVHLSRALPESHQQQQQSSFSRWLSHRLHGEPDNFELLALDAYQDCPKDDYLAHGKLRDFPYWSQMPVFLLRTGQYYETHCGLILVQLDSGYYFRVGVFFSSFARNPDDFPNDTDKRWQARKREQSAWLTSSEPRTISIL